MLGMEPGPMGIGLHTRKRSIESARERMRHIHLEVESSVMGIIQVETRILQMAFSVRWGWRMDQILVSSPGFVHSKHFVNK